MQSQDTLPLYSPAVPASPPASPTRLRATEHVFRELNAAPGTGVELKLYSMASWSSKLPVFVGGGVVNGELLFDAPLLAKTQDISLSVTGRVALVMVLGEDPPDIHHFLDLKHPLWSPGSHPHLPAVPRHTVPISFTLPKEVSPKRNPSSVELPTSFTEQRSVVSVIYHLAVRFRCGIFHGNREVGTNFIYVPPIQPGPPSHLRQLAYRERKPPPDPKADPDGWKTLERFILRGKVFDVRAVQATCTLSLANPLCYTRGTAIPLSLTVECEDIQALDLLSSAKAPAVHLQRFIKFSGRQVPAAIESCQPRSDVTKRLETALWMPSPTGDERVRRLYGEIHLAKDLAPSSVAPYFTITYCVIALPFDAPGFSSVAPTAALLTEPVRIGTAFAAGPRPVAFTPPPYHTTSRR